MITQVKIKQFSVSVLAIALCLLIAGPKLEAQDEPRNMMWLGGPTELSSGWNQTMPTLQGPPYFYDYNDVVYIQFDNPTLGIVGAKDLLLQGVTSTDVDDILSVAHCYGAITSRYAQLETDQISAMIFVGAPHQGSRFVDELVRPGSSTNTLEAMMENALSIVGENDCPDCGITETMGDWVADIKSASSYLADISHRSLVIKNINETPPTVPYINIIGNIVPKTEISFLKMFDSRGLGYDTPLAKCFIDLRNEARKDLNILKHTTLLKSLNGVFRRISTAIVGIVSAGAGNPTGIASAINDYIGDTLDDTLDAIQEANDIQDETARLLRCNLAVSYVSVQLNSFLTLGIGEVVTTEYEDVIEDYNTCMNDCALDIAWGDAPDDGSCEALCDQLYPVGAPPVTETVTVYEYEFSGHDWVYTVPEQSLESSEKVADIVINADHFQETLPPFIVPELADIFDGAYGTAFEVPKQ